MTTEWSPWVGKFGAHNGDLASCKLQEMFCIRMEGTIKVTFTQKKRKDLAFKALLLLSY